MIKGSFMYTDAWNGKSNNVKIAENEIKDTLNVNATALGDHFTVSNKEKSHTIIELWDYYQLMLLLNTLHALLDVQYAMS